MRLDRLCLCLCDRLLRDPPAPPAPLGFNRSIIFEIVMDLGTSIDAADTVLAVRQIGQSE